MKLILAIMFAFIGFVLSEPVIDGDCMEWAIRRIVGDHDVTITDVMKVNVISEKKSTSRGRHRPGKKGPAGLPGPQGPPGPQGVCDCIPDELIEVRKENEILKEQVNRIKKTSPEIFCLLGMKDGLIPDSAITSTNPTRNNFARLDGSESWWSVAITSPGSYWVMTDLGRIRHVTGVVTQGRYNYAQWVTSYKVEHSKDGNIFVDVKKQDGSELIFTGNADQNTKVINRFPEPVLTRFVRIYPITHKSYFSLRFDVIDC